MKVKILEYDFVTEVTQDPENPNHFYEFGENGRLISDYDISEIEIIEHDNP